MALIYCQRFKTDKFNTKEWFPLKACWISIIMVYLRKLVVWTDTSNIEEEKPAEWKNFNSCQLSSKLISTVSPEKWLVYNLTVLSVLLLAWYFYEIIAEYESGRPAPAGRFLLCGLRSRFTFTFFYDIHLKKTSICVNMQSN